MLIYIAAGVFVVGTVSALIIDDFKKFENERKNINTAQDISRQNNTVNKIVNLDSAINGTQVSGNLANSRLLTEKPMTYKIVSFRDGEREKDIVNRYSTAAKQLLKNTPNATINCSLLAGTNLLTIEECNLVHDKTYDFYHKTGNGSLSYKVDDENVNRYVTEIEANRYNLKSADIKNESNSNIVLDKNYISSSNLFINKKNLTDKENSIVKIKNFIKDNNYILASAELYNLKKNNYQYTPIISDLFVQLFDEVQFSTKDAAVGSEEHQLKLKIQSEFMKLTQTSNIMENVNVSGHPMAEAFIKSMVNNYSAIKSYEVSQNMTSTNTLPTLNSFSLSLNTLSSNTTQIK